MCPRLGGRSPPLRAVRVLSAPCCWPPARLWRAAEVEPPERCSKNYLPIILAHSQNKSSKFSQKTNFIPLNTKIRPKISPNWLPINFHNLNATLFYYEPSELGNKKCPCGKIRNLSSGDAVLKHIIYISLYPLLQLHNTSSV